MLRFAPGFLGFALFVLWIWAVFDVIATDRVLTRNLDKTIWLLLVIFVPTVGAVAWLALGRPVNAGFTPGSTALRAPARPVYRSPAPRGIEDSPEWSAETSKSTPAEVGRESTAAKERRLLEWEAELEKREHGLDDPDESED